MKSRLIAAAIALFAVLAASAATAPTQRVTIQAERFFSKDCRCLKFRFSGAISGGAANEDVVVLAQRCGTRAATAVARASTREDGFWSAEWAAQRADTYLRRSANMFRARWNGHLSEPSIVREPFALGFYKQSRRRWGVTVFSDVDLKGRFVELQRLAGGSWTRVRRMRLVPTPTRKAIYALFTVRQRGLTLRIFVPEETAAPCYDPTAAQTFSS